jgi:hypothetical protein
MSTPSIKPVPPDVIVRTEKSKKSKLEMVNVAITKGRANGRFRRNEPHKKAAIAEGSIVK